MDKNKRKIPLYRLKTYEEQAIHLRNQLLLWRFRNLNKIDLSQIEYGFPELSAFDRRVQQVITPIYYFSNEEAKKDIVEFGKEQQTETLRERLEAIDGQIFQIIMDQYPSQPTIVYVTTELNKDRGKMREYTEKRVANTVRKVLGFDIRREGHENISTIILNEELVTELCEYYGISGRVARVASVARVADEAAAKFEQEMLATDETTYLTYPK